MNTDSDSLPTVDDAVDRDELPNSECPTWVDRATQLCRAIHDWIGHCARADAEGCSSCLRAHRPESDEGPPDSSDSHLIVG